MASVHDESEAVSEVESLLGSIEVAPMQASTEQRIEALRRAVRPSRSGSRRRRRVTVAITGAGILAVGIAGGVAASAGWRQPQHRDVITCYAIADLSQNSEPTTLDAMMATDPRGPDAASIATSLCADAWRRGELRPSPPYIVPVDPDHPVPESPAPALSACVLESGSVGVFPGGPGTCDSLGLPQARAT